MRSLAPRTIMLALALVVVVPARADDGRRFHCDGTDAAYFEERRAAGWVGFGETWDHETCGDGEPVYASGATQWADMRPRWLLAMAPRFDVEFYSRVFPTVAFGSIGAIFGIAWLMAFVQRRRRVQRAILSCPSCSTQIPVTLDDPSLKGIFCPACGTPCVLVDEAAGGAPLASAS